MAALKTASLGHIVKGRRGKEGGILGDRKFELHYYLVGLLLCMWSVISALA